MKNPYIFEGADAAPAEPSASDEAAWMAEKLARDAAPAKLPEWGTIDALTDSFAKSKGVKVKSLFTAVKSDGECFMSPSPTGEEIAAEFLRLSPTEKGKIAALEAAIATVFERWANTPVPSYGGKTNREVRRLG